MADTLEVSNREVIGKRRNKRLRASGQIPATLYGHGQDPVNLQVAKEAVALLIRHGAHLVNLKGAVTDTALVREVQWDTFGAEVLHLDLNRVSASDTVEINVPIELKGQANGQKSGGIINHVMHELPITCPVSVIPDKFELRIANLELDGAIHAGEIKLPEGAVLGCDPNAIVVQCTKPMEEAEAVPGSGEGAEPEVITRKKEEGEEGEE